MTSSTAPSLADRLAEKTAQNRQQVEQLMQGEQNALVSSLKQLSDAARSSTQDAISRQSQMLAEQSQSLKAVLQEHRNNVKEQTLALQTDLTWQQSELAAALKSAAAKQQATVKEIEDLLTGPEASARAMLAAALKVKQEAEKDAKAIKSAANSYTQEQKSLVKKILMAAGACCLLACALIWGYWKLATPWEVVSMGSAGSFRVMSGNWTTCTLANGMKAPCQKIN